MSSQTQAAVPQDQEAKSSADGADTSVALIVAPWPCSHEGEDS